jgi:hypothetical protein
MSESLRPVPASHLVTKKSASRSSGVRALTMETVYIGFGTLFSAAGVAQ